VIDIGNNLFGAIVVITVGASVTIPHLRRKVTNRNLDPRDCAPTQPNPELDRIIAELAELRDELTAQVDTIRGGDR
jgi:hypothetical protein